MSYDLVIYPGSPAIIKDVNDGNNSVTILHENQLYTFVLQNFHEFVMKIGSPIILASNDKIIGPKEYPAYIVGDCLFVSWEMYGIVPSKEKYLAILLYEIAVEFGFGYDGFIIAENYVRILLDRHELTLIILRAQDPRFFY